MDDIIKRFCPRYDFDSYEDMKQNFKINVPDDFNFGFDVVDAWADIEPEKLALVWTNDAGDMARYTFKDVKDNSNRAVNFLLEKGIKKGDIVMLVLKQRPEVWFIITALHKIGAIVIPASFQLMKKDYVYRINAAGVKMLITVGDDDVVQHVRDSLPECPNLEYYVTVGDKPVDGAIDYRSVIGGYSTEFERPTDPEKRTVVTDTALLYFSSGTSGMPKMVRHDFSSALGQITTARYWQCVKENKIHMTQTDSGWAKFAWGKIYGQWICGAAVGAYDTEKFHPIDMIEAMERIRPSTFCAPATIYRFLIKEDLSKYDFSYIEHACLAGEPLNPEVFHQIERLTGMSIYEGFGQSESSVLLANYPWVEIKPGSMGKPAPGYDIALLDENGEECEDGMVGSICIRVDQGHPTGLFRDYWKDDAAMEKSFKFGYYNTGDTAWRDGDGYYWFVGRNDDVIKCSGYRIGPFEVESALMEHPSVLECAVTALPHPDRGQVVKATIVLAKGYEPSDELVKEIQNHVKHATAPYKYPRVVEFVRELPKTSSGKIMRTAIRAADMQKLQNEGK